MKFGQSHSYLAATVSEFERESRGRGFEYLVDALVDAHRVWNNNEDPSNEQINAWKYSIRPLLELFEQADLSGDQVILLEAMLKNRTRLDALLLGRDTQHIANAVVMELKRYHWSAKATEHSISYRIKVSKDDPKMIDVSFKNQGVVNVWTKPQPIDQVQGYKEELRKQRKDLLPEEQIDITGCVYLPECCWLPQQWQRVFQTGIDPTLIKAIPIFTHDENQKLPRKPPQDLPDLAARLSSRLKHEGISVYKKICILLNTESAPIIEEVSPSEEKIITQPVPVAEVIQPAPLPVPTPYYSPVPERIIEKEPLSKPMYHPPLKVDPFEKLKREYFPPPPQRHKVDGLIVRFFKRMGWM